MAKETSYWPLVVMVVVIVAAAGAAAGVVAYLNPHYHPSSVRTVQLGDNVTLTYIGMFASGPQNGTVFDTSRYAVATNNLTYPKSLEFTFRGNASAYDWLAVHVGPNTPSGGYVVGNYTFGSVITGFWAGLVGAAQNTSRTITIPVDQAYGPANPSCFSSEPLVFSVPVFVTIPRTTFSTAYPGIPLVTGSTFVNPLYSWNDYIVGVNGSWVSYENQPTQGQRTTPFDLPYYVSSINATNITVTSTLSLANEGKVLGHLPGNQTVCGSSQFIVSTIDWASQTFVWNFNPEVKGQSLQFVVTVTNIFPPR